MNKCAKCEIEGIEREAVRRDIEYAQETKDGVGILTIVTPWLCEPHWRIRKDFTDRVRAMFREERG